MSATAELKQDIRELEREHDALVRACDRKHDELDEVNAEIAREQARLANIKSEIQKIKAHYGVSP